MGVLVMRRATQRRNWLGTMAVGVSALLSGGGCSLAAGVFNPDFLASFGFDPNLVIPPQGAVVVSLQNRTGLPAEFELSWSANTDITIDPEGRLVLVPDAQSQNPVIFCPVRSFTLGIVDEEDGITPVAARVTEEGGQAEIAYAGAPLEAGRDFKCGDVIRVVLDNGAAAGEYVLTVEVVRSR
jgi:hypothetical protein